VKCKVTQKWLIKITGFWDVITWAQLCCTISLPLSVQSWLYHVTDSFSWQLHYVHIQFILHGIYFYLYLYWVVHYMKAKQKEMEDLYTLGVYGLVSVCHANNGVIPSNFHTFTVWGPVFSLCQMKLVLPLKCWNTGVRLHGMELIHNDSIHSWLPAYTQSLTFGVMLARLIQYP
jgi:hypothetical protein